MDGNIDKHTTGKRDSNDPCLKARGHCDKLASSGLRRARLSPRMTMF